MSISAFEQEQELFLFPPRRVAEKKLAEAAKRYQPRNKKAAERTPGMVETLLENYERVKVYRELVAFHGSRGSESIKVCAMERFDLEEEEYASWHKNTNRYTIRWEHLLKSGELTPPAQWENRSKKSTAKTKA